MQQGKLNFRQPRSLKFCIWCFSYYHDWGHVQGSIWGGFYQPFDFFLMFDYWNMSGFGGRYFHDCLYFLFVFLGVGVQRGDIRCCSQNKLIYLVGYTILLEDIKKWYCYGRGIFWHAASINYFFHWEYFQISFFSDLLPSDYWSLGGVNSFLYHNIAYTCYSFS